MKFVVGSTSDSCIDECFESVRPTEQSACLNQVSVPRNEAAIFDMSFESHSCLYFCVVASLYPWSSYSSCVCDFWTNFMFSHQQLRRFIPTGIWTFFDIGLMDAQIDYVYLNVITNKSLKPSNSGNLSYTFSTSKSLQLNLESYVSPKQTKRTALQAVGFDIGWVQFDIHIVLTPRIRH